MKKSKEVILAYKSKLNDDGKSTYIEFVGLAPKWQDREVFLATCKFTDFDALFIHITKKEWRKIKNDTNAILKKYTDTVEELYKKVKSGEL